MKRGFVGDYIFGYGSLIHPPGINGRGMKRQYTEDDLIPCHLAAHRRSWNAFALGELYLGLRPVPAIRETPINGVLFPIDREDVDDFLYSECSLGENPVYDLVDVTEHVHVLPIGAERVLTCITREPSTEGVVSMRYQHHIRRALEHRGSDFTREFMSTTDWSTFKYRTALQGGQEYKYVISDWYDMLVKERK